MPDFKDLAIVDRTSGKKRYARYLNDDLGGSMLLKDAGILTIIKNPMRTTRTFIGCMGIHGFGTLGCFKALCTQGLLRELLAFIEFPLHNKGFQIIINNDIEQNNITIEKESLHIIPYQRDGS